MSQPIEPPPESVEAFDATNLAGYLAQIQAAANELSAELDRHMKAERLRHRALVAELSGERHLSVVRDEVVEG